MTHDGRSGEWPKLPNLTYSWRMPVKAAAWRLAWWLMRRVVLGWMTPQGQAKVIAEALGAYRPAMQPGIVVQRQNLTGASGYTEFRRIET